MAIWNAPTPQLVQLEDPTLAAYVPAPHALQSAEPVVDVRPTEHERHLVAFRPENVPALHLVQDTSPASE